MKTKVYKFWVGLLVLGMAFAITGTSFAQSTTYSVRWGDTLATIARRHEISLSAIIRANPQLPNPNLIYPGQVIYLPVPVAATTAPIALQTPTAVPTSAPTATATSASLDRLTYQPPTVVPTATATVVPTATALAAVEAVPEISVATGSAGGKAVIVQGAQPPACGFGSYQGDRLSKLQGTLMMPELAVEGIGTDRVTGVGTCITFGGLIGGGQTPIGVFVNGQQVPFRGPVLISREYGDFGRFAFDLKADCGQQYSVTIGVRASDGQLVEKLVIVDVPC